MDDAMRWIDLDAMAACMHACMQEVLEISISKYPPGYEPARTEAEWEPFFK